MQIQHLYCNQKGTYHRNTNRSIKHTHLLQPDQNNVLLPLINILQCLEIGNYVSLGYVNNLIPYGPHGPEGPVGF